MDSFRRGLFGTSLALAIAAQVDPCSLLLEPNSKGRERDGLKHRPVLGIECRAQALGDIVQFDGQVVVARDLFGGGAAGRSPCPHAEGGADHLAPGR